MHRSGLLVALASAVQVACPSGGGSAEGVATFSGSDGSGTGSGTSTGSESGSGPASETDSDASTGETAASTEETAGCVPGILDCPCDEGACEEGLSCQDGTCRPAPVCGNGMVEPGEQCDDQNEVDNDGCNGDCGASGIEVWKQTFDGGNGDDEARDVFVDADGNIYVTGYSSTVNQGTDLSVLKLDVDGQVIWGIARNGAGNGDDIGHGVVADASSVYVTGTLDVGGAASDSLALLKLDADDGAEAWARLVDGTKLSGSDNGYDVALDSDGDVYVAGTLDDSTSNQDIWVARYDPGGSQKWATSVAGDQSQVDRALAIALDSADNVLVAGRIFDQVEAQNLWVTKLGNNIGNELWSVSVHVGSTDSAWGVAADPDGRILVSAAILAPNPEGKNAWVRKHTPAGDEVWTHDTLFDGDDEARRVAVDSEGEIAVTGFRPGDGGTDGWIRKLDAEGQILWTHTYVGVEAGPDQGFGVAIAPGDQVVAAGFETSADGLDAWVLKLEP